jgi:hypothetical protein
MRDTNINYVPMRNVFGASGRATLGMVGTSGNAFTQRTSNVPATHTGGQTVSGTYTQNNKQNGDSPKDPANNQVAHSVNTGAKGNSLATWFVMVVMLFGLMYGARKLGTDDNKFANIKLSAYNVLTISLAAIIGITFWKMVFTKFPVAGVSTVVLAV